MRHLWRCCFWLFFLISGILFPSPDSIIYLRISDSNTLDPGKYEDIYSGEVISNIFEGLCRFKKGSFEKCEKYAKIGLKLLGEHLPISKISVILGILTELCKHILHNISPLKFIRSQPGKKSETYKMIVLVYDS